MARWNMSTRSRRASEAALRALAMELGELMAGTGCRSAMVRTFTGTDGTPMCACNLYGPGGSEGYGRTTPVVGFREALR